MGVRILNGERQASLYCSTSDWAFGPVFREHEGHAADERAEAFLRWLVIDPRGFDDSALERKYSEWRQQEAAQFAREAEVIA